ncbi:LysR family transcriptional regulator [Burkholderia mayonis]|uniref:LysR family transcriptional regulator n=1 Tax=Burkholderia mayonis TaxID=1385591 RepID=A0A1B4G7L7_9BURK|nr:LysR family transcriptional regulator [Burkholderia mayonis]AOJ11910.1 LysR family transcriptional regulator [Burkholderia mayonis]KVE46962.1 LysR family transcriptional regulator [Burkholderia mayonis]
MNIRQLRYFVEVVHRNGFGRATEALHVTQPAISRGIKELEDELGHRLLIREPRSVRPTDEGVILLRHARLILQQVNNLRGELRDASAAMTGTLRVGLPPIVGSTFFAEVITAFRARCPDVDLQIVELGTNQLENALREGLVEVAAAMLPLDEKGFEIQRFAADRLMLVVDHKHGLARKREMRVADLAAELLVMFTEDFRVNDLIRSACGVHGFTPRIAGRSSHLDLVIAMVRSGMGATILPHTLWNKIASPELVAIPLINPRLSYELALVRRSGSYVSRSCKAWVMIAATALGFVVGPGFMKQPESA